jgi:hypothetical protein
LGVYNTVKAAMTPRYRELAKIATFVLFLLAVFPHGLTVKSDLKDGFQRMLCERHVAKAFAGGSTTDDFNRWLIGRVIVILKHVRCVSRNGISEMHAAHLNDEQMHALHLIMEAVKKPATVATVAADITPIRSGHRGGYESPVLSKKRSLEPLPTPSTGARSIPASLRPKTPRTRVKAKAKARATSSSHMARDSGSTRTLRPMVSDCSVDSDGYPRRRCSSASPKSICSPNQIKKAKVLNFLFDQKPTKAAVRAWPKRIASASNVDVAALSKQAKARATKVATTLKRPTACMKKPAAILKRPAANDERGRESASFGSVRLTLGSQAAYICMKGDDGKPTSICNVTLAACQKAGASLHEIGMSLLEFSCKPDLDKAKMMSRRNALLWQLSADMGVTGDADDEDDENEGNDDGTVAEEKEEEGGEGEEEEALEEETEEDDRIILRCQKLVKLEPKLERAASGDDID